MNQNRNQNRNPNPNPNPNSKSKLHFSSSSPSGGSIAFLNRSKLFDRASTLSSQSVDRDIPASLSRTNDGLSKEKKKGLLKNPRELWRRYVDWLYQHKDLGLYLDMSRIGFTDEFVEEMMPKFQAAFKAMEELEKGSIANLDERLRKRLKLCASSPMMLSVVSSIAIHQKRVNEQTPFVDFGF
ncbi:hypothetical protein LOK49_LG12G00139 [Camellia lanceoleosa]|uniref:Uncharacterized protein n=1 Tax=Camellia lanceoleosa TaxID=1840588 RepID=A0ACC0FQW7_9ERIC|nr:hypothetical protein LOK49_LG12G00139 [Camellia lanceoleosa]